MAAKWSGVVPSFPDRLRDDTEERVAELGGSNFTKAVIAEFRHAYSQDWWKQFWETLLAEAKGMAKNVAHLLGIPASSVSRKHDVGVTVLIGYLIQSGKKWRNLEFAPLPERQAVGIKCYTDAVSFAQTEFDRIVNGMVTPNNRLTREEFELLLWLYREDEWFDRRVEEMGLDTKERTASEQFRNEIAICVVQRARARLGQQQQADQEPKKNRAATLKAGGNGNEARLRLEQLQSNWGPGWLLAIHSVPYRWQV